MAEVVGDGGVAAQDAVADALVEWKHGAER
jgi:hypothetical protein